MRIRSTLILFFVLGMSADFQAHASNTREIAATQKEIETLRKQIVFLKATGNSAAQKSREADLRKLETQLSAHKESLKRQDIAAVVGAEPENSEEMNAEETLPSAAAFSSDPTQKPLDAEAPWYEDVRETLSQWSTLTKDMQREVAYKIYNVIRSFPATVSDRSKHRPEPDETESSTPAAQSPKPGDNTVATITVSKSNTSNINDERKENLQRYLEKKSGFRFSPHLKAELGKVATTLLDDLEAGPEKPQSAFAKLGELQEVFRGADAVTPIRDMNFDIMAWLSAPAIDTAFPDTNQGFKYGSFPVAGLRLCENNLFVDSKGRSLKNKCDGPNDRWSLNQMTSLSKAFNKLTDPNDRTLFWTAFMACTSYQETGGAWGLGKKKKVTPLPKNTNRKEVGLRRLLNSQNPEEPSTWTSIYGHGDEGTYQFAARQKNTDYEGNIDALAGNLHPCIKKWNKDFPPLAVPAKSFKRKNGGEVAGYDLEVLRKLLVEKSQRFNRYCAISKVFSNFAAQSARGHRDGSKTAPACVSPFNHFYNHFGSHMCSSAGVTTCMGKFVNYQNSTVKIGFLKSAMSHYSTSMRTKTGTTTGH